MMSYLKSISFLDVLYGSTFTIIRCTFILNFVVVVSLDRPPAPCNWIVLDYSGTPLYGHPFNTDTRFLRTVLFVPTKSLYIFSYISPLNTDTD